MRHLLLRLYFRLGVIGIIVTAALFSGGCCSMRYTTTLKPSLEPPKPIENLKFNIVKVDYKREGSYSEVAPQTSEWTNIKWKDELMESATTRYPQLFSRTEGSIPIAVHIEVNCDSYYLVSYLTGIISAFTLPSYPGKDTGVFKVNSSLTTRRPDDKGYEFSSICFSRTNAMWGTFTPLGLIPVPGESDVPKSRSFFAREFLDKNRSFKLTTDSIVEAIMLSLKNNEATILERAKTMSFDPTEPAAGPDPTKDAPVSAPLRL